MNIYKTKDTAASVRKAFQDFTHVVVNRSYHINKPVFFRSGSLIDLPIFIYQPWKNGAEWQLSKWRDQGGILMDATVDGKDIGRRDVTVIVEAPLGMKRLNAMCGSTDEYVVIKEPESWKTHESVVELKFPDQEKFKEVRSAVKLASIQEYDERISGASKYTGSHNVCSDQYLSEILNIPMKEAQTLRRSLRPQEVWCVSTRLTPEEPALLSVWNQIQNIPSVGGKRFFTQLDGSFKMWRRAVKDMARLGYIGLNRYQVYPENEPDYKKIEKKHITAIADLKAVQELLEEAPIYPL